MDFPANPFAILTFISAPAVLTNASCMLLFGTGNRYGRAIDRVHELSDTIQEGGIEDDEMQLRIRQLESAESRTLLILRALTFFYAAVAGFVASTLISLIGAALIPAQIHRGISICFALAFLSGGLAVVAMVAGALTLAWETRSSFSVLRMESKFITERAREQVVQLHLTTASKENGQ